MALEQWLREYKAGKISEQELIQRVKQQPYEDVGFAKVDLHRQWMKGFPEVIWGANKEDSEILKITETLAKRGQNVLITRTTESLYKKVKKKFAKAQYNPSARMVFLPMNLPPINPRRILVVSAGTADRPVAEEAAFTAECMGNAVQRLNDVGVAGLHRLLSHLEEIVKANVVIVAAGMEGALPSVVSGLTDRPVIAVPTSVGYGAHFEGLAPLLTMINSCSPGIGVVNIDNGFGAGYLAHLINKPTDA